MFDIGWMELLLIGIVALIVVGPKDLPKLFRAVGQFMGKARGMAREFQRSMEQAADESGLRDAARDLNSVNKLNLNSPTKSARTYAERMVRETKASAPGERPEAAGDGGDGASAADRNRSEVTPKVRAKPAAAAAGDTGKAE